MSADTAHRIIVLTLVSALVIGGAVTGDASAGGATASSVAKHKKKAQGGQVPQEPGPDQAQAADRGLPVVARGAARAP